MKLSNCIKSTTLALITACCFGPAQAASIEGVLNFTGEAVAVTTGDLGTASGLSFTSGFFTTFADGTFAASGIATGSIGNIQDFFFDPLNPSPVNAFLTIGPGEFSYRLESIEIIEQMDGFLVLNGTGTMTGRLLDPTAYDIAMSFNGAGPLVAYSGNIRPTVIPVPGALVLFASGLLALGMRRRD